MYYFTTYYHFYQECLRNAVNYCAQYTKNGLCIWQKREWSPPFSFCDLNSGQLSSVFSVVIGKSTQKRLPSPTVLLTP